MNHFNYTQNEALLTIKSDWKGTPVDQNNRFANQEFPFVLGLADVLKWKFKRNPQEEEKKTDSFRLVHRDDTSFLQHDKDCIVWLGHSTFFIRLNRINLLIDPVFYNIPLTKRYADHAFNTQRFSNLDYLLISHNHQDHCQEKSIREIVALNPGLTILSGLNMEFLLKPWSKGSTVQTAGWYQQYQTTDALSIYYLPSRHWSKRSLNDTNKQLWGGFVFQTQDQTIYFSGDTGYGHHFAEAKVLFPSIDVAIIGVGAYKPEWFMHPNHISPQDAVRAFNELGAKTFIPMHYGTFDLSDEPVGEPVRLLKQLEEEKKINGKLKFLDLGESYELK
jgi:L-ascorbate metabolism protein UlaG (beta-lactamase superfamily)